MSDDLEVLERWVRAGGTWSVVSRTARRATVALCRCDGGEEVDRLTSDDPAFLAHVARGWTEG
ncbi:MULTISPECIES: hypothetical protein [Mumia]|uniref:hypothetical protein n=1 Tax=Mumia TaxID=1546255 RepID=UPI00142051D8|nr:MULTISPECIES: hypothetical protein [unclassified Mumia]QMW67531.1 hypothetical protein H4N58_06460 [Mumia sp. ZJ1417]